jgi:hypothetical protein
MGEKKPAPTNSAMSEQDFLSTVQALFAGVSSSTGESTYDAARREFGFVQVPKKGGYIESDSGKRLYDSGAIYDPATGTTLYPASSDQAASVPGSDAWLQQIQESWDEDKVNEWRQKLSEQGYQVAESGAWAADLSTALSQYHTNRYANGGKAIPLVPGGDVATREAIRKQVDFVTLKEEAKAWGQVPFGEDLDERTADYFAERIVTKMTELARKHPAWTYEQVEAGANIRVQKEFVKAPGVKGALRDAEDDEMDETLRDSIVSISQLGAI